MNYSTESVIMKNKSEDIIPTSSDPVEIESTVQGEPAEKKELEATPSTEK